MIILPVIHYSTLPVALENAKIAFQNGCDGVFVINMDYSSITDLEIPAVCAEIKWKFPNKKVGANYLYADFITMFQKYIDEIDMIWTDDLIATEHDEIIRALEFVKNVDIFESFAFKYKKSDPDFVNTGNTILAKGRIPTTSGSGTGHAAPLEKLIQLSELPRLALASGLTPENIYMFKPYITHALVATGISDSFYTFDPVKVKDFVQAARG